jgi:hypothetical protein
LGSRWEALVHDEVRDGAGRDDLLKAAGRLESLYHCRDDLLAALVLVSLHNPDARKTGPVGSGAVARLLSQVNAMHQDQRTAQFLAPDQFIQDTQEDFSLAGSG